MKKLIQISLKDGSFIEHNVESKTTNKTNIKVYDFLLENSPLLIQIEHLQLNTLLDLTKVSPYTLLFFDHNVDDLKFNGATFSLDKSENPFIILTTSKTILLLHYPIAFKLENVSNLNV
jgi:hypothetical protein